VRRAAARSVDASTHPGQGIDDTAHRPPRQRFIADQCRAEMLTSQKSGQQPHAGTGVAAVDRLLRRAQAVQADPADYPFARVGRLYLDAHRGKRARGRACVLTLEESADA
jgi:hypothetical protein